MPDILQDLNPIQQKAVKATDGPILILAGAGSGKTRVLTYRVAYLIAEKGIPGENILVQTFTNKAAGEMKERILQLLKDSKNSKTQTPIMGTFHSICAKFLRKEGYHLGLKPGFSIYDETDALDAVKEAMAELGIPTQKTSPSAVRHTISGAKNELISDTEYPQYARGFFQETVAKVYLEYQKILRRNQALDFDDLLLYTIRLFQNYPDVLQKYQLQFRYILVDEYQDTNAAQYLFIKLLAKRNRNICVVGDASQCLLPGTQIATPTGPKSIEVFNSSDQILAAAGRGNTHTVQVKQLKKSQYKGKIIIVKTKSGKTLRATPNHILFARLNLKANVYYVYLMFRNDKGYRIGLAKSSRIVSLGRSEIGLLVRSNQESADKMWILRICKNRSEANFWEHYFVVEYGLPSMVFSTGGRQMHISQSQIDQLYQMIDTKTRVQKLFDDLQLFVEYPHHHPKGIASRISPDRQLVHFTLFSDKRPSLRSPWAGHRVSINTSNQLIQKKLKDLGHYTRAGNKNTWRIETVHWKYENALALAEQIALDGGGLTINHSAFIVDDKKFLFTPASHLRETMEIGILKGKQVVLDEIKSISIEDYKGDVYDLDVDILHNYSANGIIVHNSIYGFRGADFRNIVNFQKDYPDAKTFNLEQNYRSTQIILDAAHAVVSENRSHPILKLWTDQKAGEKITIIELRNEVEEALFVIEQIKNLGLPLSSYALLYRTNAQSRSLEEQFLKHGVPYQLVGGTQFYERKEIKDILAYLRLVINPEDSVSLRRIDKIGKTRARLFFELRGQLINLVADNTPPSTEISDDPSSLPSTIDILDAIIGKTGYNDYLDDGTDQGKMRIENVKELRSVAEQFPDIIQFLENVALIQDRQMPDSALINGKREAVTLMTIHASKGLEYPIIFLVGMEEGLFPHSRSMLDPNQMEEERRLAYVAITRAKSQLFITYTRSRLFFGTRSNNLPSRFISAIPESLIDLKVEYRERYEDRESFDDDIYTDPDNW